MKPKIPQFPGIPEPNKFLKGRSDTYSALEQELPEINRDTGTYHASKFDTEAHLIDTKAEISKIKADRAHDKMLSEEAKQIIDENKEEIEKFRAPKKLKRKVRKYDRNSPYFIREITRPGAGKRNKGK